MAVTSDPKSKKLIIRFRVAGYAKQFYLSTGLKDNKSNRVVVESRWEFIQREISLGEFDPTLERYKFGDKKPKVKPKDNKITLSELWERFTQFNQQFLEATTIDGYRFTSQAISKLPSEPLKIKDYLLEKYSYSVARKIYADLSRCCGWGISCGLVSENPFQPQLPKLKKSSREELAAYTLKQRDLIIYTFEHHHKFSHYSNLIKFLFWTGCRPGEAFALTWKDVSSDCTKITISKSYASKIRLTKGTKNGKRRIFPAATGGKLQNLLLEMRSPHSNPDDLVFCSVGGKQLTLKILDKVWRGHQTREYFYPGVVRELAYKNQLPYLKLYSTRHTFATWAIASGSSPDKVAYWLGDNVSTILTYYCHPEVSKADCPDF
ncbi:tyrosine-type recombinase/integrase [Anabaena sp. PCC 7108]|uniref:tyrosine-type recombinase/integrase n=1 Tax=Anabaena sp. PCC 7108 TaxID=163908 RepID=UPI0003498D2F|nr:tyrosine-type recombinase/integrase [Anabaena sp. PCC 7108]